MSLPEQSKPKDHEPVLYENWRGKVYLIDKNFIEEMAQSAEEEGEDASDIRAMNPGEMARWFAVIESVERHWQLEAMFAGPGSEAEHMYKLVKGDAV